MFNQFSRVSKIIFFVLILVIIGAFFALAMQKKIDSTSTSTSNESDKNTESVAPIPTNTSVAPADSLGDSRFPTSIPDNVPRVESVPKAPPTPEEMQVSNGSGNQAPPPAPQGTQQLLPTVATPNQTPVPAPPAPPRSFEEDQKNLGVTNP